MSDTETLINTLLANGLASSRSEAQRMAESMISTSNKVNESMRQDRDNSMVKDYGEARRAKQSAQEQKIEELREKALNPQPVQVQTEFDTPLNDQKKMEEPVAEATQPTEEPQLTPEFYAAQQMQNMGAQTVSDLTAEPQAAPQTNFAEEPVAEVAAPIEQSPENTTEAPRDFISQELAKPNFAQEPVQQASDLESQPSLEAQAPVFESQPTPEQVGSPLQEAPQAQNTPVEAAPAEEEPKKKNLMTEEDKKLAEEVDLSRVFNFSNR